MGGCDGTAQAIVDQTPGSHVFTVTTAGGQPHEMCMVRTPEPVTEKQIAQILEMEMQGGTPAPGTDLTNPEEFIPVTGISAPSTGKTVWIPFTLEAGVSVIICLIPDIESGMPRAYYGMDRVITVE